MSVVKRYTKKPVTIEAFNTDEAGPNGSALNQWLAQHGAQLGYRRVPKYSPMTEGNPNKMLTGYEYQAFIETLEGKMDIMPGDFVIRGIKGEFYPCKPDIFALTYDEAAHD